MADTPKPILNIYQRMILVQKAVQTVYKNDTIKMSENDKGYKATSHDDVAALLHLPLAEAGIVLLPDVIESSTSEVVVKGKYGDKFMFRTDLSIKVKWINADQPDDIIESHASAFALDSSDKGYAKAYSLALKICLLKVHLLESRDGEEQRDAEIDEPQGGARVTNRPASNANKPITSPRASAIVTPPVASQDQLLILDETLAARGIVKEGAAYWFKIGKNLDLKKPLPASVVQELIDLLSLPTFTADNLKQDADEMKLKRESKVQSTQAKIEKADTKKAFVMPLGSDDVKGKELGVLAPAKLIEIRDWTDAEMKKSCTPKKRAELFEINSQIREEIKTRGSK